MNHPLVKIVHLYERFLGLCPFILNNFGHLKYSLTGILYTIFLTSTYIISFFTFMNQEFNTRFISESKIQLMVEGTISSLKFMATIVSWMYCVLHRKKLQDLVEDMKIMKKLASKLDISGDSDYYYVKLAREFLIITVFSFGIILCEEIWYFNVMKSTHVSWLFFDMGDVIVYNVSYVFIASLGIMQRRFHYLNQRLKQIAVDCGKELQQDQNPPGRSSFRSSIPVRIELFAVLHEKQGHFVDNLLALFSFPLLIIVTKYFIQLVNTVYTLILSLKFSGSWNAAVIWATWMIVLKTLNIITILHFLGIVSSRMSEEANNTGNVLYGIWIDFKPHKCKQIVEKFLLKLLQKKLTITLHGLIRLDYDFLYRISGTVTTYLIIMLQLKE